MGYSKIMERVWQCKKWGIVGSEMAYSRLRVECGV